MLALEEIGNPEKVEPPDGIGEKFADDEGVGLAVREKRGPFDFADGFGRIGADVIELGWGYARVLVRFAVEEEPEDEPDESERAGEKKGGAPAPAPSHTWRDERSAGGPDAGASFDDA